MSSVDRNLVLAHVQSNPGRSTQEIRDALKCRKAALIKALVEAEQEGMIRHEVGTGRGAPKRWYAGNAVVGNAVVGNDVSQWAIPNIQLSPDSFQITNRRGETFVVLVDPEDLSRVMERQWHVTNRGYVASGRNALLHRFLLDAPASMEVDHVDGNPLHNRRANLRLVTRSQQCHNVRTRNSRSGYRGVTLSKSKSRPWRAQVGTHHIGQFSTKEEAALAASEARKILLPYSNEDRHPVEPPVKGPVEPAFTSFDSMMDTFFMDVAADEAAERAALEQQKAVEPAPVPVPAPAPVPEPVRVPRWSASAESALADVVLNREPLNEGQSAYLEAHRLVIEDLVFRKRSLLA